MNDVICGRRNLARKNLLKVLDRLAVSPQDRLALVEAESEKTKTTVQSMEMTKLDDSAFRLISDWQYFAIMNLARIKDNRADPIWISQRLNISRLEAFQAVKRLRELGYIKITKERLVRTAKPVSTTRNIPSAALKKYHRQNLHLAEQSIEGIDIELRELSSITMAIDVKKIPEAKEKIMDFKRSLCRFLESKSPQEVYTLAIQLFPVTHQQNQIEER